MPMSKLKITHPDRIVDRSMGTTKMDIVHYYARVASLMMPHLKARPVSLLRAPEGVKGQMFFQKHMDTTKMTGVRALPTRLDPDHEPLLEVATEQGRSEEHTTELQSIMRISYAVFCWKKQK